MIRAKFVVSTVNLSEGFAHLKMRPVHGKHVEGKYVPQAENSKFWEASPSGEFQISVSDKVPAHATIAALRPGQEFYLDLTPAPAEA